MGKVAVKPVFAWAFESKKGVFKAGDVFSSKEYAKSFADDYAGFKLVKVQISKYQPKKK